MLTRKMTEMERTMTLRVVNFFGIEKRLDKMLEIGDIDQRAYDTLIEFITRAAFDIDGNDEDGEDVGDG